jgi:outer membrane cobalamin receptor
LTILFAAAAFGQQPTPTATPNVIDETVTVSADLEQPESEVTKTASVIGEKEIEARQETNAVDALSTVPGLRIQQLGGFGRTANIKTRGLRNSDTAVLIDGIRFRDVSGISGDATPFISDLSLAGISKMEVLRGPGSSLYGTNAIGGTIDLRTAPPQLGFHGNAFAGVGGLGMNRFGGGLSYAAERWSLGGGISRMAYTKGIDGNDDADNISYRTRFDAKPWRGGDISVRLYGSSSFVRLNSDPDTFGVLPPTNATIIDADEGVNFIADTDDPDNTQRAKFFNGQVVVSHAFSDKFSINAFYSGLKTDRENIAGILGVGFQSDSTTIYDASVHTFNGGFAWRPNGVHRVTAGFEFESESYANEGFTPSGFGDYWLDVSQNSKTVYAQDLVSLLDGKLQFAGGIRAQFFGLGTPNFSLQNAPFADVSPADPASAVTFDGSAAYFISRIGVKIRTHAGTGYRVPSLYERFGTFFSTWPTDRFVAIGDPSLKPERSAAFDIGADKYFSKWNAKLSAVYFYTKLDRTIGYGLLPQPDPWGRDNFDSGGGYLNTKGGIARGGEFSGELHPTSLTDIFASYTYTNSDQREPQVAGSGIITSLGVPANQFTFVLTQRYKGFWANFDVLATSDYLAPVFSNATFNSYIYRFDGNRNADLTAGYRFTFDAGKYSLRIHGKIGNLFGYEYFENGFRTEGRTGSTGLAFDF